MDHKPSNFAVVEPPPVQSHVYQRGAGAKEHGRKASLRVGALALAGVAVSVAVAGLTSKVFWEVSHHRYANEVLREAF